MLAFPTTVKALLVVPKPLTRLAYNPPDTMRAFELVEELTRFIKAPFVVVVVKNVDFRLDTFNVLEVRMLDVITFPITFPENAPVPLRMMFGAVMLDTAAIVDAVIAVDAWILSILIVPETFTSKMGVAPFTLSFWAIYTFELQNVLPKILRAFEVLPVYVWIIVPIPHVICLYPVGYNSTQLIPDKLRLP